MSSPSAEEVIDAFINALRDELAEGNSVDVPNLGTFSVEHKPSETSEEDGDRSLTPPRNVVKFDPEN